jgi:hypothetical protein
MNKNSLIKSPREKLRSILHTPRKWFSGEILSAATHPQFSNILQNIIIKPFVLWCETFFNLL